MSRSGVHFPQIYADKNRRFTQIFTNGLYGLHGFPFATDNTEGTERKDHEDHGDHSSIKICAFYLRKSAGTQT